MLNQLTSTNHQHSLVITKLSRWTTHWLLNLIAVLPALWITASASASANINKPSSWPQNARLILKEQGQKLNHTITVTSPNNFKLGFENGLNYGLSQWYDLYHDPQQTTDLTDNHTNYIPEHEQGALFNQCINPHDLIAHVASAKGLYRYVPRGVKIIENGPIRVVIENRHHPMLGRKNQTLEFVTRYSIYADGKIFITNTLTASKAQSLTMWRNSIIGLSDPTYKVTPQQGQMTVKNDRIIDSTKQWQTNQWRGLQLNLPDWRSFNITHNDKNTLTLGKQLSGTKKPLVDGRYQIDSNPIKFGWLRGDSIAMPRQWHDKKAKFIYAYWDPSTPAPFNNWTDASIMLIPAANNPKQGNGAGIHGWKGFKRVYYEYGKLDLAANQSIRQHYLMVLGSNQNSRLADLRHHANADKLANQYLAAANQPAFRLASGSYMVNLDGGVYNHLTSKSGLVYVYEINSSNDLTLFLDGRQLIINQDYLRQNLGNGSQLIQLNPALSQYDTLAMLENY